METRDRRYATPTPDPRPCVPTGVAHVSHQCCASCRRSSPSFLTPPSGKVTMVTIHNKMGWINGSRAHGACRDRPPHKPLLMTRVDKTTTMKCMQVMARTGAPTWTGRPSVPLVPCVRRGRNLHVPSPNLHQALCRHAIDPCVFLIDPFT